MNRLLFASFLLLLVLPQAQSWFWDDIGNFFEDVAEGVGDFVVGVVDTAIDVIDDADFTSIGGIFDFVVDEGQSLIGNVAQDVADAVGYGDEAREGINDFEHFDEDLGIDDIYINAINIGAQVAEMV